MKRLYDRSGVEDDPARYVIERLQEAARVAQELPGDQFLGYHNNWSAILRQGGTAPLGWRRALPDVEAVERMEEVQRWMLWIDVKQRRMLWMRAERKPWKRVCAEFGLGRTRAWTLWRDAVEVIASHIAAGDTPPERDEFRITGI